MREMVQIHRPVSGQLAVKVLGRRMSRAELRGLLGGGIPVSWNRDRGVFHVARHHLDAAVALGRREFVTAEVYVDYRATEQCTPACAATRPDTWWDCVCSCRAANHGGVTAAYRHLADGAVLVGHSETSRVFSCFVRGRAVPSVARAAS